MLNYTANSITNDIADWTWNEPVETEPGVLEIEGFGNLPTPYNGEIFEIDFRVLLGLNDTTNLLGKIDYGCAEEEVFLTMISYDEFCFENGRRIIASPEYSASIINEPSKTDIELSLFIANDATTSVQIFNALGQNVQTVTNEYYKSGYYTFSISKNDIPSGIYYINIVSGPYSETKPVLIMK